MLLVRQSLAFCSLDVYILADPGLREHSIGARESVSALVTRDRPRKTYAPSRKAIDCYVYTVGKRSLLVFLQFQIVYVKIKWFGKVTNERVLKIVEEKKSL